MKKSPELQSSGDDLSSIVGSVVVRSLSYADLLTCVEQRFRGRPGDLLRIHSAGVRDPATVNALLSMHARVNQAFEVENERRNTFEAFSLHTLMAAYEASGRSLSVLEASITEAKNTDDVFRSTDNFYVTLGRAIERATSASPEPTILLPEAKPAEEAAAA